MINQVVRVVVFILVCFTEINSVCFAGRGYLLLGACEVLHLGVEVLRVVLQLLHGVSCGVHGDEDRGDVDACITLYERGGEGGRGGEEEGLVNIYDMWYANRPDVTCLPLIGCAGLHSTGQEHVPFLSRMSSTFPIFTSSDGQMSGQNVKPK